MPKYIYLALFAVLTQLFVAQKPFVGSLEYNLVSVDLINKDTIEGKLFIYALDSLVRYNYLMSDGKKQESIHHLSKHKLLSLIELVFCRSNQRYSARKFGFSVPKNILQNTRPRLQLQRSRREFSEGSSTTTLHQKNSCALLCRAQRSTRFTSQRANSDRQRLHGFRASKMGSTQPAYSAIYSRQKI